MKIVFEGTKEEMQIGKFIFAIIVFIVLMVSISCLITFLIGKYFFPELPVSDLINLPNGIISIITSLATLLLAILNWLQKGENKSLTNEIRNQEDEKNDLKEKIENQNETIEDFNEVVDKNDDDKIKDAITGVLKDHGMLDSYEIEKWIKAEKSDIYKLLEQKSKEKMTIPHIIGIVSYRIQKGSNSITRVKIDGKAKWKLTSSS